jgi:hypothetical protein
MLSRRYAGPDFLEVVRMTPTKWQAAIWIAVTIAVVAAVILAVMLGTGGHGADGGGGGY